MSIVIATHDGVFHGDDVLAVAIAKNFFEQKGERVYLRRTRDPDRLASADVVIDVGGEHDPDSLRFDHHQWREITPEVAQRDDGPDRAAAGLVWQKFGRFIARDAIEGHHAIGLSEAVDQVVSAVDQRIIQPVDRDDLRRESTPGGLYQLVSQMNPRAIDYPAPEAYDEAFGEAVDWMEGVLQGAIDSAVERATAAKLAVDKGRQLSEHPHVYVLPFYADGFEEATPWCGQAESSDLPLHMKSDELLCAIFPDAPSGEWRIKVLRDRDVTIPEEAKEVDGAVFVHPSGKIAGALAEEAAIEMADMLA